MELAPNPHYSGRS